MKIHTEKRHILWIQAADAAFQALLIRIRNGEAPQPAIKAVMRQFNAGVTSDLATVFSALLATKMGVAEMRAWPVGGVKLSDRLYTNAQAVSATTKTIIEQHLKGPHAARELAKALYEGYDFKADPLDVAGKLETLPKYLKVEFNKALAAKLKTPALRAAYLQAIREQAAGKGMAALEQVLKTAFYERNRYYANRIARTELHRAYTDRQSRELMAQDRIEYVQLRLSSKHPKTDICDYHAKVNLYGLGAGVYPKADAPRPPFHPHCYCLTAPMIALNPKLKPRFNPGAERAFLASLPDNEARQVAGSKEKRDRILAGKATIEEVYNEGKDELYQWKRVGDVGQDVSAAPLSATRDSPLKAVDLKSLPLVPLKGYTELDQSLQRLATDQPDWFPFGYQGLSIVDGGETLFAAVEEGQLYLSNADALIPGYRPAESFRSALQKIKAGESLAFREEYAVETVWHEMMHERTSVVAARRIVGQEPLEEGMIQLAARSTYDRLLMALGGAPPSHQADILENGLAYPSVTRNLVELIRRAGIDGKQVEKILLEYGPHWLEPFKKQLAEGLNTKRAGSLLRYANIKPLADFREKIDVQIRNAPQRNRGSS